MLVTNGIYNSGRRAVIVTMTNRMVVNKAVTMQSVNGPEVTIIHSSPTGLLVEV